MIDYEKRRFINIKNNNSPASLSVKKMINTHYKLEGTPNSPVLIFSNSLGMDMHMWDAMVPLLLPYFQILRYDTRGMGKSEVTPDPYSVEMLGKDVIDLMDKLNIEKAHFCGLSMGGQIGQWLGIHKPERLHKLIISNTAAKIGNDEGWNDRIKTISEQGMQSIVETALTGWFTDSFRDSYPEVIEQVRKHFTSNDIKGYSNCCAAVRDADFRNDLARIPVETFVVAGEEDPSTTVEDAEFMAERIPQAQLQVYPTRHITSIEQPEAMAAGLIRFLVGETTFEKGMHVRRTVLGNAHVNRANKNRNDFNSDFQDFISNYAWGEIWTRPGLSKHNRSLITIAMLIALNRPDELKMHIRAAFNNGVTVEELKEVIMQAGIYCGLPAANSAFQLAQEIIQNHII